MVCQWSSPLGKMFSGKHSPFPATFRPRRLQCSCWQLFAQSPTAVTCPVDQTIRSQCPAACGTRAQPLQLCTALTRVCVICSVSLRDIAGTGEEVLSTATFRTSCVVYHGKWHFLVLVWARQKKYHCPICNIWYYLWYVHTCINCNVWGCLLSFHVRP